MNLPDQDGVEKGFSPRPEAASAAREFVLRTIQARDDDEASRLAILTSELATNAILHARSEFTVKVSRRGEKVRVSVADGSVDVPVNKQYISNQPTGRGLLIVDSLADRWGVVVEDGGKTVWFEIDQEDRDH